ncbi:fructose 2,6-bisphosphatase [Nocardioides baekrokdamisoli]|uniref:Fructose 2,6-bisphosphatase n=1 Tax=Nocardioides baekrokdamisoli TaxID=1804624 RepID=A0A3G9IRP9_9ACTN|nr:fructose 2,6-bisphosphatase [Nocardioides baekrokdamisoli]
MLLVRHGQASFGAADYDALSDLGHEQARILGAALKARGVRPDRIVRGRMRRHDETAAGILDGLGGGPEPTIDEGWNEFDFLKVLAVHPIAPEPDLDHAGFQRFFEDATGRWISGGYDHEYDESFGQFTGRVDEALDRAAVASGVTVVVTSGGPIGVVASRLTAGDASLWQRFNRVAVNSAVTKVITGRSGATLSTFNEHSHLEHDRALLSYR